MFHFYLNSFGCFIHLVSEPTLEGANLAARDWASKHFHFHGKGRYLESHIFSLHIRRKNPGAYNVYSEHYGTPRLIYDEVDLSIIEATHPGVYLAPWGNRLTNGDRFPTTESLLSS
jgi:hypothetical protein